MIIFIFLLLFICINDIKFFGNNEFNLDYLSHKNTIVINGIFVILVFLSHSYANIIVDNSLVDLSYQYIQRHMDQAVVIPFLLFSGYGIGLSIMNKKGYIDSILKTRLPKLLLHFDIAVIIYLVLQYFLGTTYDLSHILKSLIGWKSVGNSNWYIFVMLLLYVFIYIANYITKKKDNLFLISLLCLIFSGIYMLTMKIKGIPPYFYDTIVTFNLGLIFPLVKSKFDAFVTKNDMTYYLSVLIVGIVYFISFKLRVVNIVFYLLWTVAFAFILILLMLKIKINNKFVSWCGTKVFSIYILQRIPISIMCYYGLNQPTLIFVSSCFIITIVLSIIFDKFTNKIDGLIFKKI